MLVPPNIWKATKPPADYKDVVSGGKVGKDMKALITISPKWEEDADIETKTRKDYYPEVAGMLARKL